MNGNISASIYHGEKRIVIVWEGMWRMGGRGLSAFPDPPNYTNRLQGRYELLQLFCSNIVSHSRIWWRMGFVAAGVVSLFSYGTLPFVRYCDHIWSSRSCEISIWYSVLCYVVLNGVCGWCGGTQLRDLHYQNSCLGWLSEETHSFLNLAASFPLLAAMYGWLWVSLTP